METSLTNYTSVTVDFWQVCKFIIVTECKLDMLMWLVDVP